MPAAAPDVQRELIRNDYLPIARPPTRTSACA